MPRLDIDAAAWTTLNRLLDEALDLPPETREAWLAGLPAEVRGLEPRLRELLSRATSSGTGSFLRTLPRIDHLPAGSAGERGDAPCSPGDEVGPYRLVHAVAEGGMGSVWLAERTDGLVQRPVALKLPRGAWLKSGLAERMAREREILATLDHPHVAKLYDAGVTAAGQPYLALEYVEGRRIDEFARDERLDTRARLRLFLQVAAAVAHAHSRLVVHRDLKPSNVLVTADGQVRLLDFGIAKLLEGGLAAETELTQLGGRALTPGYASPEQIAGEPIGVGADVYSLGVLLFELLAEARPYRPERDSRGALEEAILRAEPARPSEAAADPAARRALRGDLDTVVLKALKKRPEERYATVNAFAEDVERFLQGRPVVAQPDRLAYRARKFVGRNRLAVGAAAAVAAAILVGAGLAIAEKARTDQIREYIASGKPDVDVETAERDLLRAQGPDGSRAPGPRAIQARFAYGRALAGAGQLERAITELARAERDAAERFGFDSMIVASIMGSRAEALLEAGELAAGLEASATVVRILARLTRAGSYPHAAAVHSLGAARLAARLPDQALPDLTRAHESLRSLLGARHQRTLAARTDRAVALALQGKAAEAEAEIGAVAELPAAWDASAAWDVRRRYVEGLVRRLAGDPAEALRQQRAALVSVRDGPRADWSRMRVLAELGLAEVELGALAEATATLREALALFERRQLGVTPERADALIGLGRALLGRGDARAALGPLEQADRFWSEHSGGSRWAGEAALWLGRCEVALGREAAARTLARAERLLSSSPVPGDHALAALARLP